MCEECEYQCDMRNTQNKPWGAFHSFCCFSFQLLLVAVYSFIQWDSIVMSFWMYFINSWISTDENTQNYKCKHNLLLYIILWILFLYLNVTRNLKLKIWIEIVYCCAVLEIFSTSDSFCVWELECKKFGGKIKLGAKFRSWFILNI